MKVADFCGGLGGDGGVGGGGWGGGFWGLEWAKERMRSGRVVEGWWWRWRVGRRGRIVARRTGKGRAAFGNS